MSLDHTSEKRFLTGPQVRVRYGGITPMTLWRWQNHDELEFPKPLFVGNLRLWDEAQLEEWEAERKNKPADNDRRFFQRREVA